MNKITGYMYIRSHPSWNKFDCCKIGITENIINRETTYITGEIERGNLIKIFKFINISNDYLSLIDNTIKYELKDYNFYKNAGTEFYKDYCISKLINIFKDYNIEFIELTESDIIELTRKAYESVKLKKENNIKLTKNKVNNKDKEQNIIEISAIYTPRSDQIEILNICKEFFIKNNKGILILPCGAGKTIISLLFLENLKVKKIIIAVPNILLLNQWDTIIKSCISKSCKILLIHGNITIEEINEFILNNTEYIIISTYSSSHKLYTASKNYKFDILINDEVHHLTSMNIKNNEDNKEYINILKIDVKKQLSLTATPKILDESSNSDIDFKKIISNDNNQYFGNIIYKKSLLWAINNNTICDYEIQTIITKETNILKLLEDLHINSYDDKCLFTSAYASILSIYKNTSHHLLIYSNKIENAIKINNYINILITKFKITNLYNSEFHGNLQKITQDKIINSFINSESGIISCVYCLGEGWDLPLLDGVVFAENMYSNIRIVQSALRGCRKNNNEPNKINKIILPIMNSINIDNDLENLFNSNDFLKVKEIILTMGLEDKTINTKFKIYNSTHSNNGSKYNDKNETDNFEYNEDITKQFILKSIPRENFTISYEKAKTIIKNYNIINLEEYYKICEKDNRLSINPKEFYNNWINWIDYLSIDKNIYYNLDTCKLKIKKYRKIITINLLNYYETCVNLYSHDAKFPPPGLWNDFYNLDNLNVLFKLKIQKFKK
jgi:predicted helicase